VTLGSTCRACGDTWFPQASRCARCGSFDLHHAEPELSGRVISYTWVHSRAREPSPWGLAHVETDAGLRVIGLADAELTIGARVAVARVDADVPVFAEGQGT
jgi:uncharacterized OB-fold protein